MLMDTHLAHQSWQLVYSKCHIVIQIYFDCIYTEVGGTTTQTKLGRVNSYGIPTVVLSMVVI